MGGSDRRACPPAHRGESPVVVGLSGVLGRPGAVQLVLEPTLHLADGRGAGSRPPWTLALRSPAWHGLRVEAFATTAKGMVGVVRFLGDPNWIRLGSALALQIR